MTIQECRQFFEDKGFLVGDTVQLYRSEEDKLLYARIRFLHLFFESGIKKNYDEQYLEKLCLYLDSMCNLVFNCRLLRVDSPESYPEINRLLFFALPNDLEEILLNLRFQELIFTELEEYETCHNIAFAQQRVSAEIRRKTQ